MFCFFLLIPFEALLHLVVLWSKELCYRYLFLRLHFRGLGKNHSNGMVNYGFWNRLHNYKFSFRKDD